MRGSALIPGGCSAELLDMVELAESRRAMFGSIDLVLSLRAGCEGMSDDHASWFGGSRITIRVVNLASLAALYMNLKQKTQPLAEDRSARSSMKNGARSDMRRDLQGS